MSNATHVVARQVALLALAAMCSTTTHSQELLLNGTLEAGADAPEQWAAAATAGGEFTWTLTEGRANSRGARVGSENNGYALLYQSMPASPGTAFTFNGWTKRAEGNGQGELKLEFTDAQGRRLAEHVRPLRAPADWQRFFIVGQAPAGTATATAVVVGLGGGALHFDDLALRPTSPTLTFNFANTRQTFRGFGTQAWAYPATPDYPDLEIVRAQALEDFSIRYVRVENLFESASWDEMRNLRAITDALGIEWVYTVWAAPGALQTDAGLLFDVNGFARWWARHTATAHANGVAVEYIELMNEPDSGGQWSTGISYGQYGALVTRTRRLLDRMGLAAVGIIGPGTSSTSWSAPERYIEAMDAAAVAAMAGWSTHSWADDFAGVFPEGPVSSAGHWPNFAAHAAARGPDKLRIVTEIGTKLNTFAGITYRPADASPWDDTLAFPYHNVTNSQPYAAYVFANSLALLNADQGAEALLLWQLLDEPTEVLGKAKGWGMIDLWGVDKPVAGAMRTLTSALQPGAVVVEAPPQAYNPLYAAAFLSDTRVVVAVANTSEAMASTQIQLTHAPAALTVAGALLHRRVLMGDPTLGEPDVSTTESALITLQPGMDAGAYTLDAELPAYATLTITLEPGS